MSYPTTMEAYASATELLSLSRRDGGLGAHKREAAYHGWRVAGYASFVMFGSPDAAMRMADVNAEDRQVAECVRQLMESRSDAPPTYGNDVIDAIDKLRTIMVAFLEWFYGTFLDEAFEA